MFEETTEKIQLAISAQDYDAVIAVGVANFTYLSHIVLPFAYNYPDKQAVAVFKRDGQSCVVCPVDWSDAVKDQGWRGEIVAYDENESTPLLSAVKTLTRVLLDMGLERKKVGIDRSKASELFFESLTQSLPDARFVSCDGLLQGLRIGKTREEIGLIEMAYKQSDIGIVQALMHLEGAVETPGYTLSEFSERVRVHVFESGGSGVGHLATMQGTDTQAYYAPHHGEFRKGDIIRTDVTNHYHGYWANSGRMAVIGQPTPAQVESYRDNLTLKKAAERFLRAGVPCSGVFKIVEKKTKEEQIPFWEEVGIGHGVGLVDREAPYLSPYDNTLLQPGMVVVLDIYTYGLHKELIHSKDAYEILEDGCRLLSWYRSWDELYAVTGFRATH